MFSHILCPIDGSAASLQALDMAAELATEQKAQLTICIVADVVQASAMAFGDPAMSAACLDALDDEARGIISDAAERVRETIAAKCVTLDGQPVSSIVGFAAANGIDLVVMGSHGRSGIQRVLLGSVAEGVLRQACCPVLVSRWTGRTSEAHVKEANAPAQ